MENCFRLRYRGDVPICGPAQCMPTGTTYNTLISPEGRYRWDASGINRCPYLAVRAHPCPQIVFHFLRIQEDVYLGYNETRHGRRALVTF